MGDSKKVRLRGRQVAYFSSLRLPKGKSGKFEITHTIEKKGTKMTCVSHRDAIFWSTMGRETRPSMTICEEDVLIHKLQEDGQTWMSDCPQEILSQRWQIERFKGKVLVGGLGLGWAVMELEQNPKVTEITVVELSRDVVDLVWKHLPAYKSKIYRDDLYHFLKIAKEHGFRWDYAFYDIWCPTGERVLQEHIIPLREASEGIIKQKNIECWQELTMLGQVKMGLESAILMWDTPAPNGNSWVTMPEDTFQKNRKWFSESYAFYNWMRTVHPNKDEALKLVDAYARTYSNQKVWRKTWGRWDK